VTHCPHSKVASSNNENQETTVISCNESTVTIYIIRVFEEENKDLAWPH
jgi:hypothetical protein